LQQASSDVLEAYRFWKKRTAKTTIITTVLPLRARARSEVRILAKVVSASGIISMVPVPSRALRSK
jgi:hypothetical protein